MFGGQGAIPRDSDAKGRRRPKVESMYVCSYCRSTEVPLACMHGIGYQSIDP